MKYKTFSIIIIISILIITVIIEKVEVTSNRYHQHLEAQPKVDCTNHSEEEFCTHLPLIVITTADPMPTPFLINEDENIVNDGLENLITNDETVSASIKYYDNKTNNNHLTDKATEEEIGLIRTRGRSSRKFDKKGYYIKFKEENLVDNKDISLSDMTEDSDWILHGPFLDKTLIRNYLCYNLSGEIMEYAPNVRFCEMFLNNEYMGIYVLTEKIAYNDDGRINITQTDEALRDTSYILKLDVGADDPLYDLDTFTSYTGRNGMENRTTKNLEIIYPSSTLTQKQKEGIEEEISNFEKALVSFDSNNEKTGYPSYIDVSSFVEYLIINEFTMNSDAGQLSTYYYKDIRGKIHMAVWDFNSAFNNYIPDMADPHYFMMIDEFWFDYLLKDQDFVEEVVETYQKLRKSVLSDEYLFNYIDETILYLGDAIERNNKKWGYSYESENNRLVPEERNPTSYEEAIEDLKYTIGRRGNYMDENIGNLYSLCHNSINKQFKHKGDDW